MSLNPNAYCHIHGHLPFLSNYNQLRSCQHNYQLFNHFYSYRLKLHHLNFRKHQWNKHVNSVGLNIDRTTRKFKSAHHAALKRPSTIPIIRAVGNNSMFHRSTKPVLPSKLYILHLFTPQTDVYAVNDGLSIRGIDAGECWFRRRIRYRTGRGWEGDCFFLH
ncbi:hypothetical protein ABKA04_009183 [Annulohypoxylon sp. FPYF3050]